MNQINLDRLSELPREEREEIKKLIDEHLERSRYGQIKKYFSNKGDEYDIKYWQKHWEFMQKGAGYMFRCISGANRIGKSNALGAEVVYHATGDYPTGMDGHPKWEGKIFYEPVEIWIVGSDPDSVRSGIQKVLIGDYDDPGTGLLPRECIVGDPRQKPGAPELIQSIKVRHKSGGLSKIYFKTSKQGVNAFKSASVHFVGMDEMQPWEIFTECATRLASTNGLFVLAASPEEGFSNLTMKFMPHGRPPKTPSRCGQVGPDENQTWTTVIGWKDVIHLDEKTKRALLATYLPHEIRAKTEGLPSLGKGLIWPIDERELMCRPFEIPFSWPRAFAFDPGGVSACIWGAYNKDNDTWYIYDEYKVENRDPLYHVAAIKARGAWIPGIADPSIQRLKNLELNRVLLEQYRNLGLEVQMANNSLIPGLQEVWLRMNTNRVKIFTNCQMLLDEIRTFSYGKDNMPAKDQDDHECDCLRYLMMSGLMVAGVMPDPDDDTDDKDRLYKAQQLSSRDSITGY